MEAILKPLQWTDFPVKTRMAFKLMRIPFMAWFMIGVMNIFIKQVLPDSIIRSLNGFRRSKLDIDNFGEVLKG